MLRQASTALAFAQKLPAGHMPCDVLPAGQYAPGVLHATCVLGVAQYDPASHSVSFTDPEGQ